MIYEPLNVDGLSRWRSIEGVLVAQTKGIAQQWKKHVGDKKEKKLEERQQG